MKDLNPHAVRWSALTIAFVAMVIFFMWILLSGCSEIKKGQKAVNRVNADANLQNEVVNKWLESHPQDTATHIIISEPKVIEIYNTELIQDTTGRKHLIDSVIKANEKEIDCGNAAADAYDLGYDQAEKHYISNPIQVKCPPDTTYIKTYNSQIRRLTDSINKKNNEISAFKSTVSEKNDAIDAAKKERNKLLYYFIGAILVGVFSHIARSYIPKLPSLLTKINPFKNNG